MKTHPSRFHLATAAQRARIVDTLDPFTRAYLVAALWSSADDAGEPLDREYSLSDYHASALASAIYDCKRFQREHAAALAGWLPGNAGADLWLVRNGFLAGFWREMAGDEEGKGNGESARHLTGAARMLGAVNAEVGSDGAIHLDRENEFWQQGARARSVAA